METQGLCPGFKGFCVKALAVSHAQHLVCREVSVDRCRQNRHYEDPNSERMRPGRVGVPAGTQGKQPKTTKAHRNSGTLHRPQRFLYQSLYRIPVSPCTAFRFDRNVVHRFCGSPCSRNQRNKTSASKATRSPTRRRSHRNTDSKVCPGVSGGYETRPEIQGNQPKTQKTYRLARTLARPYRAGAHNETNPCLVGTSPLSSA